MNNVSKYDLIELIILELKGCTGINFQYKLKEILSRYHKSKGKSYEMPRHYGGDKKNDGWVKEDKIFYQIFAPSQIKKEKSLKKEIVEKFKNDLEGLLEILYTEKLWGGKLAKFVFIINTFDTPLPEDSGFEYEKIINFNKNKYGIEFEYEVNNLDYIKDLLEDSEKSILESIGATLRINHLLNVEFCSANEIYSVICEISNKIAEDSIESNKNKNYYQRISSEKKITINNLIELSSRINTIITKLDVVEKAISLINEDLDDINKFEVTKDYIIKKYEELRVNYKGKDLYDKIIEESANFIKNSKSFKISIEFLIVYIFDKCDIFEKEENYDFTK